MKLKLLTFVIFVFGSISIYAQEESLALWKFDVPYVGTRNSESQYEQNKGIEAKAKSGWTNPAVLQVGGVAGGYFYVGGWDNMEASPRAYFLFPQITIPSEYAEIHARFYLKGEENAPNKYALEYSLDGENSWIASGILVLDEFDTWKKFDCKLTGIVANAKISFRIKGASDKGFDGKAVFLPSNGGVDEFEVVGIKTASGAESIISDDIQISTQENMISIKSSQEMESVRVFNSAGQLVFKDNHKSLVTTYMERGTFIVEVLTSTGRIVKKIIM